MRRRRYCERFPCPTCGATFARSCEGARARPPLSVCPARQWAAAKAAVDALVAVEGVAYDAGSAVDECELRINDPTRTRDRVHVLVGTYGPIA